MTQTTNSPYRQLVLALAWAIILLISDLPDVISNSLFAMVPGWLFWAKVGVLGAGLALAILWKPVRQLWQFTLVFLVFYLALALSHRVGASAFWQGLFEPPQGDGRTWIVFTLGYLNLHLLDLGVALLVIAALLLTRRSWREAYLVRGQMDAPIEPVPWLGIKPGESWRVFGWIFTACAGAAILLVVLSSTPLSGEILVRALPYLPVAVLLAAVNAFAEESYYRLSLHFVPDVFIFISYALVWVSR